MKRTTQTATVRSRRREEAEGSAMRSGPPRYLGGYKVCVRLAALLHVALLATSAIAGYAPVEGGWEIQISGEHSVPSSAVTSGIGEVEGNPRLHRRPLYPPADKKMIWNTRELQRMERCGFRKKGVKKRCQSRMALR